MPKPTVRKKVTTDCPGCGDDIQFFETTVAAVEKLVKAAAGRRVLSEAVLPVTRELTADPPLRYLAASTIIRALQDGPPPVPAPPTACHIEKIIINIPGYQPLFLYVCIGTCPAPQECIRISFQTPRGGYRSYCACGTLEGPPPAPPATCHSEIRNRGAGRALRCFGTCANGRCRVTLKQVQWNGITITRAYCVCR